MNKAAVLAILLSLTVSVAAAQDIYLGFDQLSDDTASVYSQPYTLESALTIQNIQDKDFGGTKFILPEYRSLSKNVEKLKGQVRDFLPATPKIRVEPLRIAQAEYSNQPVTVLVTIEQDQQKTTYTASKTAAGNKVIFKFPSDFKKGGNFFGILKLPTEALGYDQKGVQTVYAGWAYAGVQPDVTLSAKPIIYDLDAYKTLEGNVEAFQDVKVQQDKHPLEAEFDAQTEKNIVYHTKHAPAIQAVEGTAASYAPKWTGRDSSEDLKYVPNGEYNISLTAQWIQNQETKSQNVEKGPIRMSDPLQSNSQTAQYKLKKGERVIFGDYSYKILDVSGSSVLVQAVDQQFGTTHLAKDEKDITNQIKMNVKYPDNLEKPATPLTTKTQIEKAFLGQFIFSRPENVQLARNEIIFTVRQFGHIFDPNSAPSGKTTKVESKPVEKPASKTSASVQQPKRKIITNFLATNFQTFVQTSSENNERSLYSKVPELENKIFVELSISSPAKVTVTASGPRRFTWSDDMRNTFGKYLNADGKANRRIFFDTRPDGEQYYQVIIEAEDQSGQKESQTVSSIKVGKPKPVTVTPRTPTQPISPTPSFQPPAQTLMPGPACIGQPHVSTVYYLVSRRNVNGPMTHLETTFTSGSCVPTDECKRAGYVPIGQTPTGQYAQQLSGVYQGMCPMGTICCAQLPGRLDRNNPKLQDQQGREIKRQCAQTDVTQTHCETINQYCIFQASANAHSYCDTLPSAIKKIKTLQDQYGINQVDASQHIITLNQDCARYTDPTNCKDYVYNKIVVKQSAASGFTNSPIQPACRFIELKGSCKANEVTSGVP